MNRNFWISSIGIEYKWGLYVRVWQAKNTIELIVRLVEQIKKIEQ